jgi:hypothetical protein
MATPPTPPTWLDKFFGTGYVAVKWLGSLLPQETILDFAGPGVTVADDAPNGQTIITITGGSGTTTTTTANVTVPAVGATVTFPVVSTASLAPGLTVFLGGGGGYYQVTSVTDGTHFVGKNLGTPGNAAPASTINSGSIVIPSGPTNSLIVEANSTPVTVRGILNFVDGVVLDNPGNASTDVYLSTVPPPGAIGTTNTTLGATNTWTLFAANGQTLTQNAPSPGVLYRYTHSPGGVGTLVGGGRVTLLAGTGGFTIVDPQNTLAAPASSVQFLTDGVTYEFILDSGSNVFRCVN